ncbi:MAG: DUF1549 domain-containing protein [Myxococcales bacterium]|nr:DUF1549 domain-containing protein [Myxococcales bacterium]
MAIATRVIDAVKVSATGQTGGGAVAAPADDAEFVRRVYLDLVGRIPAATEAARFLDDAAADKRARLVDALLASDEYATYWANVYADLLLGQAQPQGLGRRLRAGTVTWLEEQLGEGRPYDAMIADVLTASGDYSDGGPASYLLVRGRGKQVEAVAGATARIVLGVQIDCAQCHDHPYYDQYKQEDFYAFAAYFGRTQARRLPGGGEPGVRIVERPRGELRMPTSDGGKGEVVRPRFLGREVAPDDGETRREALVRAIRGSDLLAKAAANRSWSMLLGRGLVEPWDDLVGENDPSHPPALERLAADFVASGYDHRALLRSIVLSDAYQRSASGADDRGAAARVFARAAVRPLSARQLFDSMVEATGVADSDRAAYRRRLVDRRDAALREYSFVFADDEMAEAESFSGNVPQALLLLNGDLSNVGVRERAGGTVTAAIDRAEAEGIDAGIAALYLSAYARRPDADELAQARAFIEAQPGDTRAYEDLLYALLLSSEFTTNH